MFLAREIHYLTFEVIAGGRGVSWGCRPPGSLVINVAASRHAAVSIGRLVNYFVRPGGDSSIDKRPVGKGGSYDHGYVSRRRIRFEPRCGLISRHRRHVEVHEN